MALDFSQIIVDKCAGKYDGWCCLSADQMIALVAELRHADSDAEIVRFHQYVCGCNSGQGGTVPNPPNSCIPGTPGCGDPVPPVTPGCTGNACNCTEALKKACSDSGFRYKLYAAASALTAALIPLGAAAASPVGLAALSTLKDYGDAVRGLAEICVTGSATKDDVNDFCSQRAAAISVADKVPGGLGMKLLSPLESLLESVTAACCADYKKPVPIQEEAIPSGFVRPKHDSASAALGQEKKVITLSELGQPGCDRGCGAQGSAVGLGVWELQDPIDTPISMHLLKRVR